MNHRKIQIGVLAVQGAFAEHIAMLKRCQADAFEIRSLKDLQHPIDGLILPGGESTVQIKLLHELGLFNPLKSLLENGLPVYGTCAGLILLAKKIENDVQEGFALMDITVIRNAYGRQLGSFFVQGVFNQKEIPMPFIRAPLIHKAGNSVEILSTVNHDIVAAKQQNKLVTAFHPEVTLDSTVHHYFLRMVQQYKNNQTEKSIA